MIFWLILWWYTTLREFFWVVQRVWVQSFGNEIIFTFCCRSKLVNICTQNTKGIRVSKIGHNATLCVKHIVVGNFCSIYLVRLVPIRLYAPYLYCLLVIFPHEPNSQAFVTTAITHSGITKPCHRWQRCKDTLVAYTQFYPAIWPVLFCYSEVGGWCVHIHICYTLLPAQLIGHHWDSSIGDSSISRWAISDTGVCVGGMC